MNHNQLPIGSGFGPSATAEEVLAGVDLSGKNVVVTGGHAGIGLEATRALSKAGASVTVGARDPERARAAVAGIARVEVAALDLLDPTSINTFAVRYLASGRPLHILINNAGIMGGELLRDGRGFESQFATNHLGHFHLTLRLRPALRAARGARVVNVSSAGHHLSDIRWEDPHFTTGYDPMLAYGQSKTANSLFAVALDQRWADDCIRGYAVHPGVVVDTNLTPWMTADDLRAMAAIDESGQPIIDPDRDLKTAQQGASTTVFAATSPLLAQIGGVYLNDNDVASLNDGSAPANPDSITPPGVAPHAINPQSARRLWELSERLLSENLYPDDIKAFNESVIEEYRQNDGAVGQFDDELILLTTTGARSGQERVSPLGLLRLRGRLYIAAGNGGKDNNPAWVHNLRANPRARIEVGIQSSDVTARELSASERAEVFLNLSAAAPHLAQSQAMTNREIPVFELCPMTQ